MSYKSRYRDWLLSDYFDAETKEELEAIKDNEKEIEERFYKNLDFGTGGMRGKMGAGTNRINKYIVRKATQGLANYIINYSENGQKKGVVIAYDSRHKSPQFALEAALVLAANDIKTYLFKEMRATPELSFAVRELDAVGGIVITASHNPPEYNGYKLYWEDGGQIVPAQARDIIAEIEEIDDFSLVKTVPEAEAAAAGLLNYIGEEIDRKYLETLIASLPDTEFAAQKGADLTIAYTPLHGTGSTVVPQLLNKLGFENVNIVSEQADGDSDFSTVESPNPEDRDAFELVLELAEEKEAELVLATDPDCDRMAPVVRDEEGNYQFLNGNEAGLLFADYLLETKKEAGDLSDQGVIIKSIVSTDMVIPIAEKYGVEVLDVLTGFKFIGEKMTEFEKSGKKDFILGFEESLGYLIGKYARDKDAAVAAGLAAIMALKYKKEGSSLLERLSELRAEYGYYLEDLHSIRLEGKEGQEIISRTLASLREEVPTELGGRKVELIKDYQEAKTYNLKTDQEAELEMPKSNVLQYYMADGSKLTIRPSGTEPKLKFYFAVKEKDQAAAEAELEDFKEKLTAEIDQLMEDH